MLRSLAAHPQIKVVHQIAEPDTPEDFALFKRLRRHTLEEIDATDRHARHRALVAGDILVLKNAVWIHPAPWRGFILARNPFAVIASALFVRAPGGGIRAKTNPAGLAKHADQVRRWARGIDPEVREQLESLDLISAFALLYARKMVHHHKTGQPIVRYEEFVVDPEPWLRRILRHLRLEWDDSVMRAHEAYPEGTHGHGGIALWKPIHAGSLDRYRGLPDETFDRIHTLTAPALDCLGYSVKDREVSLNAIDHRF